MGLNYNFDMDEAVKYGLDEAIMLQNFKFWLKKNKANEKHQYDGKTWTYNTKKAFTEIFPCWTERQIRRILDSLIEQKIIITGNYNKDNMLHTLWYALVDESSIQKSQIDMTKKSNRQDETGECTTDNIKHSDNVKQRNKDIIAPENTGANQPIKTNHPEKSLVRLSRRIFPIVQSAFATLDFCNKLPADTDEICSTKTFEAIQTFFYNLHECKIKSAYAWDEKWIENYHIDFSSLREKAVGMNGNSRIPFEVIAEMTEKAVENYKLMLTEGYWPEDKKRLTLNFKNFLYNFMSKNSWFLFCLFNEPKRLQELVADNVIKDLPVDVQNLIVAFGEGENGQAKWSKLAYYAKIKDLYTWYTVRLKKLKKYHDMQNQGGFYSALGSFGDLIDKIHMFMGTWDNGWSMGNFGRNCKTWDLFTEWVSKEFGFDIDVSDKVLDDYEKRYDERYPEKIKEKIKNNA